MASGKPGKGAADTHSQTKNTADNSSNTLIKRKSLKYGCWNRCIRGLHRSVLQSLFTAAAPEKTHFNGDALAAALACLCYIARLTIRLIQFVSMAKASDN